MKLDAHTIDYVIIFCSVAAGLLLLIGAIKNHEWIHNGKKSTLLIDHEGENRRRIIIGTAGVILLAIGLWVGYETFFVKLDIMQYLSE